MVSSLLRKYFSYTPSFSYVYNKYFGNNIDIDHIAHRSFDMNPFIQFYREKGFTKQSECYNFPRFNVTANWLKFDKSFQPDHQIRSIFVSQYLGSSMPKIKNYNDYLKLQSTNQYMAWTLLHGHDINHVAITVKDIQKFLEDLKQDPNIKIATTLQISRDGNLKQFSLQADTIDYKFSDGTISKVPYTFVEFIERLNGREGFESDNADKIFDSTKVN